MTIRKLDDRLAAELSKQVGVEIHLLPVTDWLEAVEPAYRDVHSEALATGDIAVAPIPAREQFAASLPLFASTGEAVVLIEARLPAEQVAGAVGSFVRRLVLVTILLAAVALFVSLILARRIGAPLQALASSAARLGQGDFSSSIPAQGTQEVEALAAPWKTCAGTSWISRRRSAIARRKRRRSCRASSRASTRSTRDRRIRYLNPQAARMLGEPADALIGRFCGDVLKPREVGRPASLRHATARSTPRATTARRSRRNTSMRAACRAPSSSRARRPWAACRCR